MTSPAVNPETSRPGETRRLWTMILLAAAVLMAASSARHALLQSNAWDLAIFDQGIWLLSQGLPAVETINNMHIIADHGAVIHWPTSLLYRVWPDVHWLFALQAAGLALGAWPVWLLARDGGMDRGRADLMAACYLLYPLVFNLSLFDYHPEALAVPGLLWAALAARRGQVGPFLVALTLVLSTKEALGLTVMAMGLWLFAFEGRRRMGMIALVFGLAWFLVITTVVMPAFDPRPIPSVRHWHRFDYLGATPGEAIENLVTRPGLLLGGLFTLDNLFYVFLLMAPVAWGLSWRHMAPLAAALPVLMMNLLSAELSQKNLVFQYAAPILPFIMISVVDAHADGSGVLGRPAVVLAWAVVGFLALGKVGYFWSIYLEHVDNWSAARVALAEVPQDRAVLTMQHLAPHLSHRQVLHLVYRDAELDLGRYDIVLLDTRRPGSFSDPEVLERLLQRLSADSGFGEIVAQDGIHLFSRLGGMGN